MRACTCCGEVKLEKAFSNTGGNHIPVPHCRDCGVWLHLFRQVFGPTRNWEKNRENTRLRKLTNQPALALQEVWGIRRAA